MASSRYDDIVFISPDEGWAVNSNGQILHTTDGASSWTVQFQTPVEAGSPIYLRCVGFADRLLGWVGTVSGDHQLYETLDGGANWSPVHLPSDAPVKTCGLWVVNTSVVYASGTNDPRDPARMMKTVDGGGSWTAWSMEAHADALIDVHFFDSERGIVVGGKAKTKTGRRKDLRPVVLVTSDGGVTWDDRAADLELPLGEWGWKVDFVDDEVGYVSLESFANGAVLRTADGGLTWERLPVTDPQGNTNLEGVGFLDRTTGWVGGWGDESFAGGYTSATTDGGRTWLDANEVGKFVNRFRFFRPHVDLAFGCGEGVYKLSAASELAADAAVLPRDDRELLRTAHQRADVRPVVIEYDVPDGTQKVSLEVFDRFGTHVATVVSDDRPVPGRQVASWDVTDNAGLPLPAGTYLHRLTVDRVVESGILDLGVRR